MRKIKVLKWMAKDPSGKDSQEDTTLLFELMLKAQDPQKIPRGLDKFRIYSSLNRAFLKAKKTGILELDELHYKFLKDLIEEDLPAVWAMNPDIEKAVELFMDARLEGEKEEKEAEGKK